MIDSSFLQVRFSKKVRKNSFLICKTKIPTESSRKSLHPQDSTHKLLMREASTNHDSRECARTSRMMAAVGCLATSRAREKGKVQKSSERNAWSQAWKGDSSTEWQLGTRNKSASLVEAGRGGRGTSTSRIPRAAIIDANMAGGGDEKPHRIGPAHLIAMEPGKRETRIWDERSFCSAGSFSLAEKSIFFFYVRLFRFKKKCGRMFFFKRWWIFKETRWRCLNLLKKLLNWVFFLFETKTRLFI